MKIKENFLNIWEGHAVISAQLFNGSWGKGGTSKETEEFYGTSQRQIYKWNRTDYVIVSGDSNARVGNNVVPRTVEYSENNIKTVMETSS